MIRTIDLFAGAGGLSLGFELANRGFEPVFAVESAHAAAQTFKANFACEVIDTSIEDVVEYPTADVIIGGPPCQGFSTLGRDRDATSRAELNSLWEHYLDAVRKVRPKAFVIENVPQFQKSAQFASLLELMDSDPDLAEYQYGYSVLNAADYGVPQARKRGIFVAVRRAEPLPWPPAPTHGKDVGVGHATVRDALSDLPRKTDGFDIGTNPDGSQHLHFGRRPTEMSKARYRAIPAGGNRFDLRENRPDLEPPCWARKPTGTTDGMGRLWWDRPSSTIRTEFFKPEKGRYLHPTEHRVISHREAARIQTFPDHFTFEGTKIEVARQIGNAVPPLLAKAIADFVAVHAFGTSSATVHEPE